MGWRKTLEGGRHFGHGGAREFNCHQRDKDVPTFHGSMNIEDFLDRMSQLDTFFKFYEIPMGSRVVLVAYKVKGGAQSWWKDFQLIRECQGKLPINSWERMKRELCRRNDLSKTESQQVTRYVNGLSPQIHDKISLVLVYTLDDA
nr:hypothetical protein [Tanacetum cinerariifolium]